MAPPGCKFHFITNDIKDFCGEADKLTEIIKAQNLSQKDSVNFVRKNFNKTILNEFCFICDLSIEYKKMLDSKVSCVKLSLDSLIKNKINNPDVQNDDYAKLSFIIKTANICVPDKIRHIKVFKIFKEINNKIYEVIIKTTQNGEENFLVSFHISNKRRMKNKKQQ